VINHLVLFRLKPGISREDARVVAVVGAMTELPRHIPEIRSWQHGFNLTADADAWDYALQASFAGEAELHTYFDHPAHRPVVDQWLAIADLAFADFVNDQFNQEEIS
jgi:hypothetical protein